MSSGSVRGGGGAYYFDKSKRRRQCGRTAVTVGVDCVRHVT